MSDGGVVTDFAQPSYAWKRRPAPGEWPGKLLGWLLTAIATSFGAQFWFNLLSEALKLRATGPKPGTGEADDGTQAPPKTES